MKLDNVGVAVRNVTEMREFFDRQLGLEVQGDDKSSFLVTVGEDSYLYVFAAGERDPGTKVIDPDLVQSLPGVDHLSFRVADVDSTYERLAQRGVRFLGRPRTRRDWGLRVAPFADPEGNLYFLIAQA